MYPVMLDVRGRSCLVVGGGGVALRKVQGLVEEGARVTVVAPELVAPLERLAAVGRIRCERRRYRPDDVAGQRLVFAATDDLDVNREIAADGERSGAWVNVADDAAGCSLQLPSRIRRGPLQLAIGSSGEAPFAVRRLRQLLEQRLGPEWGEWLEAAARFRHVVLEQTLDREDRETLYDQFFAATVDPETFTARVPSAEEETRWLGGAEIDHRQPRSPPTAASACRGAAFGPGRVALVGAGPGCPGLLTVRGRRRLLEADVVVYDRLAAGALPAELGPDVELHPVGKNAGNHPVPQGEINALLVRLARQGRRVVRLKGGDPYVFGRGGEEAEVLAAEGIPFEVIPGVTSGIAALAWAGIPVTHRRESVRVTLLTAHEAVKSDGPQVRWDLLAADEHATIIGYMGVTALPAVVERLLAAGMSPQMPAAMVELGTTAGQRRVVATVAELPRAVEEAGLGPPALFAIGPTVRHADRLDWFGRLPLAGQRLVVPEGHGELGGVLEAAGAEVVEVPIPVTPAARVVIGALPISGAVVTSRAEVDGLHEERDSPGWARQTAAWCLGEAALERARERGWVNLRRIDEGLDCADLVACIAAGNGAA